MEELLTTLRNVGQSAPYLCASLTVMGFGFYLILIQGRPVRPVTARTARVGFEDRMTELGFASLDGGWDGTLTGRRIRVARVDDPTENPPVVLELSTPIPSGTLIVGSGDPEQTAIRSARHLGDADFDPWFEVQGDPEDVALLGRDVRRSLRNSARTAHPRIERGWLTLVGPANVDVDTLIAPLFSVALAVETAAALDPSARVRKYAADPDSAVRVRCLEMLAAKPPGPVAAVVARSRLDDPDPTVRTLAAVLLKDAQRLVTIARSSEAPAGVRRRAARALMHAGSNEEKMAAATALAAGPEPLHSVAWELSEHLGNAAEPVLIQLVGSTNGDVARDAAGLLAKIGSIRAIPALREFQDRTGKLDGPIRQELASAIRTLKPTPGGAAGRGVKRGEPTQPLHHGSQPTISDHESPTGRRPIVPKPIGRSGFNAIFEPAPSQEPTVVQDDYEDDLPSGPNTRVTGERRTPASRTIRKR